MSKQRKVLRFNVGDILYYSDKGIKWQKIEPRAWRCIDAGKSSFTLDTIQFNVNDNGDWIAPGFILISFKNYLNEIERSITDKGTN